MSHEGKSRLEGNIDPASSDKKTDIDVPVGKLAWLDNFGKLRDGILFLGSVVYLLGYLSWENYAFQKGLGLLPALDSQFFTAGILPALILGMFIASVRALRTFSRWLNRPLSKKQKISGRVLHGLGLLLIVCSVILHQLNGDQDDIYYTITFSSALVAMYFGAFFSRAPAEQLLQGIGKFALWSYLILGSLTLLYSYFAVWFPKIPQELGGPRPQCVVLDLDRTQLSKGTANFLIKTAGMDNSIYQSKNLWLMFEGGDFLLLKTVIGDKATHEEGTLFKVPKSIVHSIRPNNICKDKLNNMKNKNTSDSHLNPDDINNAPFAK